MSGRKKVIVTGCYDFFHSGHVRFFEEASELGDLSVVVGNDENVRLLKGAGHPLFTAAERRFNVGAVRYVKQALVSTGMGWMDAEPEIAWIKPDLYVVNEDGDKPEKRQFCRKQGIEYVVLKRLPKEGLTRRTSTDLRGF
jgi:cytidyltransferase-like protein